MTVKNTVLMALTGLLSFLIAALLGKVCIPWLHKLHFGQTILDIGPSWHHDKQGTPTMGGILFILSSTVTFGLGLLAATLVNPSLLALPYDTVRLIAGAVLALGCGAIGFLDDYIKVVKKRNKGLTPLQKLLLQLLLSAAYAILLYTYGHGSFNIPFFGTVNWGVWFIPFCMFVVVALSNATNLTDGVDGLCGMTSFVAALAFLLLAGLAGLFGECLFAVALAALAFGIEQPFLLVPVGILYIAEDLSVILQVGYFKLTHGKRLFKMSPLHHHFELCGWSENKIVTVFTAITLVGSVIAVLLMLAR